MDNLRPWCISRQLWWGHQLPVWYCENGHINVVETEPDACFECGSTSSLARPTCWTPGSAPRYGPSPRSAGRTRPPDLAYFYPTNVLSTARDIIFLWVARMVMMGLEFMGDIPFSDVYIHSVIQAPDGRRMSKSLGTGIDPLEMIAKYGADATRFGLLFMSSTQDVRFSEEKIAMGRNFANKLWNAGRLVLLATEGCEAERSEADEVDRWIASRFQRCLQQVEAAVADYDFTAAVDALYHFVWDEFCDWYLELVKVRAVRGGRGAEGQAAGHARFMLDQIVRLLHPFLPFVTEEIAAQYGAAPLLEQQHPRRDAAQLRPADEAAIGDLQAAVDALRRFRADAERAAGQGARGGVRGDEARRAAGRYAPYAAAIRALARTEVGFDGSGEAGATVVLVPGGRLEVAAVVDKAEELARLEQQLEKAEAEVRRGEAKLANEGFMSRAPEAVVAKEREKLAAYVADRDGLAARLAQLRGG